VNTLLSDEQIKFRRFIRALPGCNADDKRQWDELCPDGAIRYYEGDDPDGFAAEMLALYNIDVRELAPTELFAGWDEERSFFIPAGLVGEIYGSDRWPLGS
jgi:hypothetical protein